MLVVLNIQEDTRPTFSMAVIDYGILAVFSTFGLIQVSSPGAFRGYKDISHWFPLDFFQPHSHSVIWIPHILIYWEALRICLF